MKAKIKKVLVSLGCILIGVLIVHVIDDLTGASQRLEDIGGVMRSVHRLAYMLWGAALALIERSS